MMRKSLFDRQKINRVSDGQGGWRKQYYTADQVRGTIKLRTVTFRERQTGDKFVGGKHQIIVAHLGEGFHTTFSIQKGERLVDRQDSTTYAVLSTRVISKRDVELQLTEIQTEA